MTKKTLEQQLAENQARGERIKTKIKKQRDGAKYVFGGMVLAEAKENPKFKKFLIELAETRVTRQADIKRIKSTIEEWKASETE